MEDCFAYQNGKCKVLKVKKCDWPNCGFYKTEKQYELDQQKALEKIASMGGA